MKRKNKNKPHKPLVHKILDRLHDGKSTSFTSIPRAIIIWLGLPPFVIANINGVLRFFGIDFTIPVVWACILIVFIGIGLAGMGMLFGGIQRRKINTIKNDDEINLVTQLTEQLTKQLTKTEEKTDTDTKIQQKLSEEILEEINKLNKTLAIDVIGEERKAPRIIVDEKTKDITIKWE